MRIVIDTNVIVSGTFFGGYPGKILSAIASSMFTACATKEIVLEYNRVIKEMIAQKEGTIDENLLQPFVERLVMVERKSSIKLSRDPDDDKFIECAKDANALYIVSGDKDLLVLKKYQNIQIVTAKDFCEKYLN